MTGYSTATDEITLPPIIPVKVDGDVFWSFLDTGSGRNFISKEAIKKLQVSGARRRHESKEIITINGTKRQSMSTWAKSRVFPSIALSIRVGICILFRPYSLPEYGLSIRTYSVVLPTSIRLGILMIFWGY
jgi:hypothetical protein